MMALLIRRSLVIKRVPSASFDLVLNDRSIQLLRPSALLRTFTSSSQSRAIEPPRLSPEETIRLQEESEKQKKAQKAKDQAARILEKVPARFRPHAQKLLAEPGSFIVCFLLLHEISAVAPLFGFFWLFQYLDWAPPLPEDLMQKGIEFFSNAVEPDKIPAGAAGIKYITQGASAYILVKVSTLNCINLLKVD